MTRICVSQLTITDSDKSLSPGRRQAIIWTNAGILLIGPLETNLCDILININAFSLKKMRFKMSGKWRPFCLGLNELNYHNGTDIFIITYTLICTLCCIHYRIFQQSAHCAGLYTQLGFPTAQTLDIAIIQAEFWYGLNSFGMAMFQVSNIRIENIFRTCTFSVRWSS